MGWTVWYQLVRARAPSTEELAALAGAVEEANAAPWDGEPFRLAVRREPASDGVIVDGASKIAMSLDETEDGHRMMAAINAVLAALPGASLRLHDDLGAFGILDGRCSLEGEVPEPPSPISSGELVAIDALVPTRKPLPAGLDKALAALAGGVFDGSRTTPTVLGQALTALTTLDRNDPRRVAVHALLEAVPEMQRAQVGLDRYGTFGRLYETREYIGKVVDQIEDVRPLVPAFIAAWRHPKGLCFYGDMPWSQATRDRFARMPEVIAQMEADLVTAEHKDGDDELPWRCAEHAAGYLARSGAPRAVAALIALVRRWRGRDAHWRLRLHLLQPARKALGDFPHPRAAATLALELAACRPFGNPRDAMLRGLARLAPHRALPILHLACDRRAGMRGVVEALAAAGTPEAMALFDTLRAYPHRGTRAEIAWQDRQAGREPIAEPPMPAPEALIAHADADVRQDALEGLIQRGDRTLYTTLLHAEALHRKLQVRHDDSSNGPSWRAWEEHALVPPAILRMPLDRQLAWAEGEGVAQLGPQVHLEAMESVRRLGVAAVVADYPDPRVILSADETAALIDEEDSDLQALLA